MTFEAVEDAISWASRCWQEALYEACTGRPVPLSRDTARVLGVLRERTGEWLTRPMIRSGLGLSPQGFGEAVVGDALHELARRGIHIEEDVAWVSDLGRILPMTRDLLRAREVSELHRIPCHQLLRENVYRLP